ncbi:hypothetical protein PYW08_000413 [Mythimna loreyi]|uniref:Uncharacterized protein n=1 Tax=Mythimna loreyi TaxID=667449 RepID=A0ACC2RCD8_9NEOP|nr:hypothetical protein PYW08_000413 [Mythimna loreyi]
MPVTRSEGKGRKPSSEQKPSSSEATTSATGTSTEATSESTQQSGTTYTKSSEQTYTSATTDPTTVASAATTSTAAASAASAPPAPSATVPPPPVRRNQPAHSSSAPLARRGEGGDRPAARRSCRKSPEQRKSCFELFQVELAAARLAALETEETDREDEEDEVEEEDGVSLYSEVNARVYNWLDNQEARPVLAIANEPHQPQPEPMIVHVEPPKQEEIHRTPAGGPGDIALLAEAITRAVSAAQRPKFIELPFFSGSHQEWLPFRAAYYESEPTFSNVENINRLRRNLKGKAREAVEGLLITNAHPSEVMKTLESRFERPESIAMIEMETLRSLPRLTESPRDICIFATKISNVVATLKTLGCYNYMYNPELAKTLLGKLTPTLQYRYYDFSATQPKEDPCLVKMERFFKREAELCRPFALPEQMDARTPTAAPPKKTQRVTNVIEKSNTLKCFVCDETSHSNATECDAFKKKEVNSRWDTAKSKRLCFRCLRYRSKTHRCTAKPCGVNGCKYTHHKLLHQDRKIEQAEKTEK